MPDLLLRLEPYPSLVQLLELWNELRRDLRMGTRRDFDALALRPWIGSVHLIEVSDEGRYRYRIFGTNISQLFRRDLQNHEVGDLPEPERSEALLDYGTVVQSRSPYFVERQRNVIDKIDVVPRPRLVGKLCLPLSDDGTNVSQILAAIYPRKA